MQKRLFLNFQVFDINSNHEVLISSNNAQIIFSSSSTTKT